MKKWKKVLIVGLLCVPLLGLLWLTAKSCFVSADPAAQGSEPDDPGPPTHPIEEIEEQIRHNQATVAKLREAVPQPGGGSLPDVNPKADATLNDVVAKLRDAQPAYDLVREFTGLPFRWSPANGKSSSEMKEKCEEQAKQIQGFIDAQENDSRSIRGSEEIFKLARAHVAQFQARIGVFDQFVQVVGLWGGESWENYDKCVKVLNGISLTQISDAEENRWFRDRIAGAKKRAVYRSDYYQMAEGLRLPQVHVNTLQTAELNTAISGCEKALAAITGFLDNHPSATSRYEQPMHDWVIEQQEILKSRRAFFRTWLEVVVGVDRLDTAEDLGELRTRAAAVAASIEGVGQFPPPPGWSASAFAHGGRAKIVNWLTSRAFPLKGPAEMLATLEGCQEAVQNNQKRLIGVFVPPPPPSGVLWRYYPCGEPASPGDPGETILPFREGDEPATPKYVKWAEEFNATSERLCKSHATQAQWLEFLTRCQEMEQELQQYRAEWHAHMEHEPDQSFRDWTFLPAGNVLPHRDLEELSEQLEEVQRAFRE